MTRVFGFSAPTSVVFGPGARSSIPSKIRGQACGVISSPSVISKPEVSDVLAECGRQHELVVLGHVSPNPRLTEIEVAFSVAIDHGVDTILAVGGGSVMDAAKLLRIAVSHEEVPRRALDDLASVVEASGSRDCLLVAVPTTAGTGAEVSRGAIITDDSTGTKRAARGSELIPDVAVIDPELALTLPAHRTAETGFDVIAHAIETYLSRAATPLTDVLSLAALEAVPGALRKVIRDGSDLQSRETLALHAWLMGYNLAHASTCLPHRMQYPVGSLTDTSHQIGLAALYPAWLDMAERVASARVGQCIDALHLTSDGEGERLGGIRGFLDEIGLKTSLKRLGVDRADLVTLANGVSGRTDLDPIDPTPNQILELFTEAYDA